MKSALPWIACLLAAACSSARLPERFHTLLPAARAASAPAMDPVYVDVLPVAVPPQVDHAQWVVRQGDDSLLMLEQDRWAAPLADELRGAISERLATRWGAVDIRGVALPQPSVWRVRVDVQRFESVPGREARIESVWSVSGTQRSAATLVCRSVRTEPATGGDVATLAAAHRRAVTALADEIGQRVRTLQAGQAAGC